MEGPKAPQWEVPINIPLVDSTYTLASLIGNIDDVVVDEYGLLGLKIQGVVDTTYVAPYLSIENIDYAYEIELQEIEMPSVPALADKFTFSQLSAQAASAPLTAIVVDPFEFDKTKNAGIEDIPFVSAKISGGLAKLTISNALPVSLKNLTAQLINNTNSNILLEYKFDNIASLASLTASQNISDITISTNTTWRITGQSDGSGTSIIVINKQAPVTLLLELQNIRFSAIESFIPDFSFTHTENVPLLDSLTIEEAKFRSGNLYISVVNRFPFKYAANVIVNEFIHKTTAGPFKAAIDLDPNEEETVSIDLSQYKAVMTLPNVGQTQTTPITFEGTLYGTEGPVTVGNDDGIAVELAFRDMFLEYIEGRIDNKEVVVDETETGISLPIKFGGLEGLKLGDAKFYMNVYNTVSIPVRLEGFLKAVSSSGEEMSIDFGADLNPSTGGEALTVLQPFETGDSDILDFVNLPPNKILFTSKGYIGDGVTVGRVDGTDYLRANYTLEIASKAIWENKTFVVDTTKILIEPQYADLPEDEQIDKSFDSEVTKNLNRVSVRSVIENHTPAGLSISFRFATDPVNLTESPDLVLGPISISTAQLDDGGYVTKSIVSESDLVLSENDLELFQNPSDEAKFLYIETLLELHGSDGKEVQLFSSDYIRVQSYVNVTITVKDD